MSESPSINEHSKQQDLDPPRRDPGDQLTINQGVRVSDDHNSLKGIVNLSNYRRNSPVMRGVFGG